MESDTKMKNTMKTKIKSASLSALLLAGSALTLASSALTLASSPLQATSYPQEDTSNYSDETIYDVTITAEVPESEFQTMKTHVLKYRYNAELGTCVNAKWQQGYNELNEEYLFKQTVNSSNGNKMLLNKDAECVDFSGLDFYQYTTALEVAYLPMVGWNLQGANFDGTSLIFVDITDARLEGAKLDMAIMGYTRIISGTSDVFTAHFPIESCQPENQLINCHY